MTKEEKKLLERELSVRSQYGVLCAVKPIVPFHDMPFSGEHKISKIYIRENDTVFDLNDPYSLYGVENIKPYLRPMNSMTDEERKEYFLTWEEEPLERRVRVPSISTNDWLNEHHFDYRGLIPMGLALEAPENMYKTE